MSAPAAPGRNEQRMSSINDARSIYSFYERNDPEEENIEVVARGVRPLLRVPGGGLRDPHSGLENYSPSFDKRGCRQGPIGAFPGRVLTDETEIIAKEAKRGSYFGGRE